MAPTIPPSFKGTSFLYPTHLPPSPELDLSHYEKYPDFKSKFDLGHASTEKDNPRTSGLSVKMETDVEGGLRMLLQEEVLIIQAFNQFATQLDPLAKVLAERGKSGRIIFVGVGSSGRVGVDLAAKSAKLCSHLQCLGVMGGGDSAMILAQEDFEDSALAGEKVAGRLELKTTDTVIAISASGSSLFTSGFANKAADAGVSVYYFCNSQQIPRKTHELFNRSKNPAKKIVLDTGPQAIAGSTRLQAFSIARICFSYVLGQAILLHGHKAADEELSSSALVNKLKKGVERIQANLSTIAELVKLEKSVLAESLSEISQGLPEGSRGFITWLGTTGSWRELAVDCVELPATFFLTPLRRNNEPHKRRAEIQPYLVTTG